MENIDVAYISNNFSIRLLYALSLETNTCKRKLNQKWKLQPPIKHLNFLAFIQKTNKPKALPLLFALSFVWNLAKEERSRCLHREEVESPPKLLALDTTEPPSSSMRSGSTIQFRMSSFLSMRSTTSSTALAWSAPSTQDLLCWLWQWQKSFLTEDRNFLPFYILIYYEWIWNLHYSGQCVQTLDNKAYSFFFFFSFVCFLHKDWIILVSYNVFYC